VPNWDLPTLAGAGALRSTVQDMLTFLAANLDSTSVFRQAHVSRHAAGNANMTIGLGWHILTRPGGATITWHNGGTGGYRSFTGFDAARRVSEHRRRRHRVPSPRPDDATPGAAAGSHRGPHRQHSSRSLRRRIRAGACVPHRGDAGGRRPIHPSDRAAQIPDLRRVGVGVLSQGGGCPDHVQPGWPYPAPERSEPAGQEDSVGGRGAGRNRTDESRFCTSPRAPAPHSTPLRSPSPGRPFLAVVCVLLRPFRRGCAPYVPRDSPRLWCHRLPACSTKLAPTLTNVGIVTPALAINLAAS